jgi:hypothetical protein
VLEANPWTWATTPGIARRTSWAPSHQAYGAIPQWSSVVPIGAMALGAAMTLMGVVRGNKRTRNIGLLLAGGGVVGGIVLMRYVMSGVTIPIG